ncbi:MAG: PIN domain-containing protein [Nocardioidaceae bacterium]
MDTCALFPVYLCDTLLRLAEEQAFRPLWSDDVLTELERNLHKRGLDAVAASRRIQGMRDYFPDAEVHGYQQLIPTMTCDPKDRHVLAAAVRSNVEVLVTFNLKDFPREALDQYEIEAVHPDEFLLDQLDLYPGRTLAALRHQISDYARPPTTLSQLASALCKAGVPRFAAEIARHPDVRPDFEDHGSS